MRQRERGLTSSIALECSPIPGACVSTFCIASAASQLSAHAVGASGMAARTQGDGRAAAQRTVVERVDHVVHNPKGLVAVEGAIDLVAVFSHCTPGAGRFLNTGREKSVRRRISRGCIDACWLIQAQTCGSWSARRSTIPRGVQSSAGR